MNNILPIIAPSAPVPVPPPAVMPLVYGRRELALALGISVPTLDRLDAGGKLPGAVRVGGRKVWLREIIAEWLRAGAPERRTWEALQGGVHK